MVGVRMLVFGTENALQQETAGRVLKCRELSKRHQRISDDHRKCRQLTVLLSKPDGRLFKDGCIEASEAKTVCCHCGGAL